MMKTNVLFLAGLAAVLGAAALQAQQPQIPTLQVCNKTGVRGAAAVKIDSRVDAGHAGTFKIRIDLKCDPAGDGFPAGALAFAGISLSDSSVGGALAALTFEQVTTAGKHTPTAYINGRCRADGVRGCHYWLMIADNHRPGGSGRTPDIVSFLVLNAAGQRVTYGTGPVVDGDLQVDPN